MDVGKHDLREVKLGDEDIVDLDGGGGNEICWYFVCTRIGIAKETFHKMQSILKDRKVSMTTRIRILQCYIYPVLPYSYGC